MKINWKEKLSSRKFWAAVIAFLTPLLAFFGAPRATVEQIVMIITAVGGLVAYILAEGYVDGKRNESEAIAEALDGIGEDKK